jgi:predicted O-methyltransferase YrrM
MNVPSDSWALAASSPAAYQLPSADDDLLWRVWLSAQWLPALTVADELGLFDRIDAAPMTAAELASSHELELRGVTALLSTLAALRFLAVCDGRFELTDVSRTYLRKRSPHYSAAFLRLGQDSKHAWLAAIMRKSGQGDASGTERRPRMRSSAFPSADWARGSISAERARVVASAMHGHSLAAATALAHDGRLAGVRHLLDIGGGSGCFSIALALNDPRIRCTILELPQMCAVAREYVVAAGVCDQVALFGANMFRDQWPRGHDAVWFSNVLHDWSPQTAAWLLRRAFETLPSGGRVFIHEMLLDDDGSGPLEAASFSLVMFVATEGQQFTQGELISLLYSTGFEQPEILGTRSYYSLVTARHP